MPLFALAYRHLPFACAFAALLLPIIGQGALTWETLRIEQTTKPNDTETVAQFRFANKGQTTVTITNVQSSCGCTTATLEKKTYAPGEAGEIKATFTLGNRVGLQEKSIYVVTDDPSARPVSLVMQVTIPELLAYSPRLLMWKVGGARDDKTTTLTAIGAMKITAVELTPPVPVEVTTQIEIVETGKTFRLSARPVSTAQTMNITVAGIATFADGTKQPFAVYALVR